MNSHYTNIKLSNGLQLLTVPMPSVQSVTALVMLRVGSRNETAKQRGISHFLEHMPFKGTQKYTNSLALASAVDGVGAEFNAFTSKEYTGFYVKADKQHLELALDILSQLVFFPLFDEGEIEKEKGVIIEEINMYEDQPMAKVVWDFEDLLYGDTPLGWDTVGTKETVRAIMREDFVAYKNKWYLPDNMVLGLAGAIGEGRKLAEIYFDGDKQQSGVKSNWSPHKYNQNKPALNVHHKKTEQAHLCFGVRTYPREHPDRYALAVLATLLGGNMSSRMFSEVREKRGLAYYVRTATQSYLDNGYLMTRAGTDLSKTKEAVKVILGEYHKISNSKFQITKSELTKSKDYLKGKLILDLEDSEEVASMYVEDILMEAKAHTPEEIIKEIEAVTADDLHRVAREIFKPANLNLAIIGPFSEKDRQDFENIIK